MVSKDCTGHSAHAERLEFKTQPLSLQFATKVSNLGAALLFIAMSLQFLPGTACAADLALGPPNPDQIAEDGGSVAIPVTITRGANDGTGDCTVTGQVVVEPGGTNATLGDDFSLDLDGGYQVTLPDNPNQNPALDMATVQVSVTINEDGLVEGNETVAAILSQEVSLGQNCIGSEISVIPSRIAVTFTIIDNDTLDEQAPTVSEGDNLTINGSPGQGATSTFTVTDDASGIDITAQTGTVVPARIDGTSGTVTYTFPVPANASPGEQFTDTITLTDTAGNEKMLSVAITTAGGVQLDSTQEAMNNALLALCPNPELGTELAQTCANLPAEGTQARADALSQIAPDELSSQSTMAVEASNGQAELVGSRLSALRTGATGLSLSGLNINLFGQHLPSVVLDSMLPRAGASGDEPGISTKFGFFVNGNVRIGDKDRTFNEPGFDFDAFDATMGLDYRFTPSFVFGGALGYGQAETDFDNSAGNIELDGYKLSLYGTYYRSQAVYVDGIVTVGFNSYDTRRRIAFANISENAVGDTDGSEISAAIGGGYDFTRDAFVFGPFGRVNYLQVDIDGYQEAPTSSGLELRLNDQEVTSITAAIGGKAIYNISTTFGVLSPQLNVEYEYELDNDRRFITGVFANDPVATVWGFPTDEPDRDVFNVGVGGSATLRNETSGFLFFETMLGHDDVSQYSITGGLRFEF